MRKIRVVDRIIAAISSVDRSTNKPSTSSGEVIVHEFSSATSLMHLRSAGLSIELTYHECHLHVTPFPRTPPADSNILLGPNIHPRQKTESSNRAKYQPSYLVNYFQESSGE